nr:MAG TPA: hypothetical protein [Caudoviricetes sp.]
MRLVSRHTHTFNKPTHRGGRERIVYKIVDTMVK